MAAFACAHRGLSSERAENTLAAFGAAVVAGFPAIEMDLRATADGEVVVLHDAGIERTTDGVGRVDSMTWRELRGYSTADGPVPRLADLMAQLAAWDGLWNLEVKAREATAPAIELARRHGLAGRTLLSSMDAKVLREAQEIAPDIPRASIPLGPLDDGDLATVTGAGCTWMNMDHDFLDGPTMAQVADLGRSTASDTIVNPDTAGSAATIRRGDVTTGEKAPGGLGRAGPGRGGVKLGCWTVNDVTRARELDAMGVACVITDARAVGAALAGRPASW